MNLDKETVTRLNDYKDEQRGSSTSKLPQLSTDQIMTKPGSTPLYYRRRTHILRFVNACFANRVPRYLFNYFNLRNRDIHRHETRNSNDVILEKVNLECTKSAFFYKSAKIFITFFYNCSNPSFSVTIL